MLTPCAPPSRIRIFVEVRYRQGAWLMSSRTGLTDQVCNMLSLTANRTGMTHQVCHMVSLPQVFTHVTSTKHTT
jgi:Holliday junction resolvase-like predicted endonuclease